MTASLTSAVTNPLPSSRRMVFTLAWPAVLEQLLNSSIGLVNTYIVGHLGAAPLAALGLSEQSLMVFWALFAAIGVGSTALVARRVGAREHQSAKAIAQQSILVAFIVGLVASIALWIGAPQFLRWLGAEPDVIELGTVYARAVASTTYLVSILFSGSAILRGAGDTRSPMLVMLLINVVNIIVAYALANGLGPLPALGVLGCGISAAVGRGAGGLAMLALLVRGRSGIKIQPRLPRPDADIIGQVLRIGMPAAGEQLLMRFGQLIMVTFIAGLGTVAVAAHQVTLTALSVAFMPGWGFSIAAATLVGQELGANRPQRSVKCGYEAALMSVALTATLGVLVTLFPRYVLGIFINDPAVVAAGIPIARIAGLIIPFTGASFAFSGGLRGAGDTVSVLLISTACVWALRVAPANWLAAHLGLIGIWLAIGADHAGRAVMLAFRFRSGKWKLIKV